MNIAFMLLTLSVNTSFWISIENKYAVEIPVAAADKCVIRDFSRLTMMAKN